MTKVVFFKSNGVFWGFEEQGHSGFASSGEDILCSAISAMTMLVINAIEVAYTSDADYEIDEETANVRLIARGALPTTRTMRRRDMPSQVLLWRITTN